MSCQSYNSLLKVILVYNLYITMSGLFRLVSSAGGLKGQREEMGTVAISYQGAPGVDPVMLFYHETVYRPHVSCSLPNQW